MKSPAYAGDFNMHLLRSELPRIVPQLLARLFALGSKLTSTAGRGSLFFSQESSQNMLRRSISNTSQAVGLFSPKIQKTPL